MGIEQSKIGEELVTLTEAIAESKPLREWFFALESLPLALRVVALRDMVRQMKHAGEDAAITSAIATLARAEVHEAVREALREIDER